MSFWGIGAAVVAVGTTVYGAIEQSKASKNAAQVDTATAAYNAKYDDEMAAQLDMDTLANIDTERQNDKVYLSKQEASYASAGVLATSGSPLAAQITNAGRMEQRIQQEYVNSQKKQESLYSQAAVGVAYGAAQAASDRTSASIALIDGGAKVAGMLGSDYESGVFKGGGSATDEGFDD